MIPRWCAPLSRLCVIPYVILGILVQGCGPGGETDPGANGSSSGGSVTPEDTACGAAEPLGVQMGEGVGSAFVPFVDGDRLRLEFASQAGMEAAVSVRTLGVALDEVDSIELSLLVDGAPIGTSSTSGASLRCEELWSQVDTAILIDVTGHPTVTSVAQLVDREAELRVEVQDAAGVLVEDTIQVVLEP